MVHNTRSSEPGLPGCQLEEDLPEELAVVLRDAEVVERPPFLSSVRWPGERCMEGRGLVLDLQRRDIFPPFIAVLRADGM